MELHGGSICHLFIHVHLISSQRKFIQRDNYSFNEELSVP